jgi:hypothetical protein
MKTSHIGLVLVSALLAGCAGCSPKAPTTATSSSATVCFRSEYLAKLDQTLLSLETGYIYTNRYDFQMSPAVEVIPQPVQDVPIFPSPFDVPHRRDMSLIDDTNLK